MSKCARVSLGQWDQQVNYFHFGDALVDLTGFAANFAGRDLVSLRAVNDYLTQRRLPIRRCNAFRDVVEFLTGPKGTRLSLPELNRALQQCQRWQQIFRTLGCRGFSLRLATDAFISLLIRPDQMLKVALLTDTSLYYPPLVRRALGRISPAVQHLPGAIGWMLGRMHRLDGRRWWFITNVQSDIMSQPASCLRDIFRGWQRILFWLIIGLARNNGISKIALPSATAMATHLEIDAAPGKRVNGWRHLYDGVASYFDLPVLHLPRSVNIQPLQFSPQRRCSTFYVGEVELLWDRFGAAPWCEMDREPDSPIGSHQMLR